MKSVLPNRSAAAVLGALAIFLAGGCERDGVKVYHVDTNDVATATPSAPPAPATAAPLPMPSAMPAGLPAPDNSGLPKLKYTLPDGWQEKAPSEMRVASFGVSENGKSVDVSVVPLGGMAGGDFANVNRWRGQLQLEPADDNTIQQSAEKVAVGDQPADLYDLNGATADGGPQRIIAVIAHRSEAVWFFKMFGDAALAEKQKPAFIAFLKSIQFVSSSSAAPAGMMMPVNMGELPASHPPIGDVSGASSSDTGVKPMWTVPAGWQPGPPSAFLVGKYVIGSGDATADVNISSAGIGGGLAANVNRWRGQLGLPASTDISTTPLEVSGGRADLVDLSGTDARSGKPARLIGVMVSQGAQTWFYKLMGDPGIVAQQKDAFTQFIQSAKYPDAH